MRQPSTPSSQRDPRLAPAPAAFLAPLLALTACTTVPPLAPEGVSNPRSVALVCMGDDGPLAVADCPSSGRIRAFITSGSKGSVSIAVPAEPAWYDTDPSVPGFTPLFVGGLPDRIVGDPTDPGHLYLTLGVAADLPAAATTSLAVVRIDVTTLDLTYVPLTFRPAGLAVVATSGGGGTTLFISDPNGGRVWTLPTSAFDVAAAPQAIVTGGSPSALAWVPAADQVYVGHMRHNQVTVLSTAGAIVERISLGPACDDGLDNDGDGHIDAADPGCDDRLDRHEGDPELGAQRCGDGVDNDGDGATDAQDPSCAASATTDSCRDGVDNDGDGATDYPADPSCAGFGGDEWAGNPSCNDGVDNDGDGQTDLADDGCSARDDDDEMSAVGSDVLSACADGVDNDGDGQTDLDDSADCPTANSGGEVRPKCDDGIDDDGDGLTDAADPDCFNRAGAAEVRADDAPDSEVAVAPGDGHVLISHRQRRLLYVVDTATGELVQPVPEQDTPFSRPSKLALAANRHGLGLDLPPLAMAPLSTDAFDGIGLTLSMGGLVQVRVRDKGKDPKSAADDRLSIGLIVPDSEVATKAAKPTLQVDTRLIDLGASAPKRYASFGPVIISPADDGKTNYYGLTMSDSQAEHRTEIWRFRYQGRIPGSDRHTGRLLKSSLLRDAHADFCRLGVVPGDWLLLHRGNGAADCSGLEGDVIRYAVVEVRPTELVLDGAGGVVDTPVTADNQIDIDLTALKTQPLPPLACVPRSGLRYEIRASQWLVTGSRTGLLSSRGRKGGACMPWTDSDPAQAARLVEPRLRVAAAGETVALKSCPPSEDDLADNLRQQPYAGGAAGVPSPMQSLVFAGSLVPGCQDAESAATSPRLLPSIRDMTWTYAVATGLTPRTIAVGANPVGLAVASKLGKAYVADQGHGALYIVSLAARLVEEVME